MEAPIIEQLTVGFQVRSLLACGSLGLSGALLGSLGLSWEAPIIEQLTDRVSSEKPSGLGLSGAALLGSLGLSWEAPIIEQLTELIGFQVRSLLAWGSLGLSG